MVLCGICGWTSLQPQRSHLVAMNELDYYGVTFQDADLAQLPETPEDAWQTGRLNPAFGKSEIEKLAFREVFQAIQRMLDTWKTYEDTVVEAYMH